MGYQLFLADCLDVLPTIESASVDCVISDPPYPEISRDYGRMTESAWMEMMQEVVRQTRRVLKPTGSAVFILQPNSRKVGSMRLWLWEFMVWAGREWNIVQDAYWWNYTAMPEAHAIQGKLLRTSTKMCVWLGGIKCYRNQNAVLWSESDEYKAHRMARRALNPHRIHPGGHHKNEESFFATADKREGVTPFNLLPLSNGSRWEAGAHGHGAGTPLKLADWWVRYICPPGGVVADWFSGTGTMGLAALQNGCSYIGIERMAKYHEVAQQRLADANQRPAMLQPSLLNEATL